MKKITVVSAVTKNCLKDFLLMRKSLQSHHEAHFHLACDDYCYNYLNGNFENLECEQIITSNGADHVRGDANEKEDFIQIIKCKFNIAKKTLSSEKFILWCDVDHFFFNPFDEDMLDLCASRKVDAALTPHFSDGFADEKTVGYYNCGFAFISNMEFLNMWSKLFDMHKQLGLYFEQKPLEVTTQTFTTVTLPLNYNVGWWKFMGPSGQARQESIKLEDTVKFMNKDLINFHFNFFKQTKHAYDQKSFQQTVVQLLQARGRAEDLVLIHEIERLQNENI
jgi:hypothetical protein